MATTLGRYPILVALWLLWLAVLATSFVLSARRPGHGLPVAGKIASSAALALAAWVAAGIGRPTPEVAVALALGMSAGLMGDLAMSSLLPLAQPLMGGIAAFGVGHVLYCAAMLLFARDAGLTSPPAFAAALVVWLGIGAVGWYYAVWRGTEHSSLHAAALVYAVLLAATAGLSSGLALQRASLLPLALGGALFLFSDLILAAGVFGHRRAGDRVIWGAYGPAQMLIVYSLVLAAA